MKHGQEKDARQVLARLRAQGNAEDPIVERELADMKHAIEATEAGGRLTAKELFSNGPEQNRTRLLLAVGAQAMQQIGGINLVTVSPNCFRLSTLLSPLLRTVLCHQCF